jgi:hypothetical protein
MHVHGSPDFGDELGEQRQRQYRKWNLPIALENQQISADEPVVQGAKFTARFDFHFVHTAAQLEANITGEFSASSAAQWHARANQAELEQMLH